MYLLLLFTGSIANTSVSAIIVTTATIVHTTQNNGSANVATYCNS